MAFRGLPNEREYWERFCRAHPELVSQLGRVGLAFTSPSRFEELLQAGSTRSRDDEVSLGALSDQEWELFAAFVSHYSMDWQSYFVRTLYPAYFREAEKRQRSD